ncbi:recombination protein RecR [Candidatus Uhrbacteria bacterium]|nr:recombination protein RecR [Candidatus Uhrbacteria bacterium]
MSFPRSLQHLIGVFQKILPGVGPKNAERFALALVRSTVPNVQELLDAIGNIKKQITTCAICFDFAEKSPCAICADPRRDSTVLCVVADTQGVLAIEKTSIYKGRYLVLGGLLSPIEGRTPDQLKIKELESRVQKNNLKEVILAFDSTMDGEATALYIKRLLAQTKIRVTRLARGLPMGSDLEYADEITLTDALQGRRDV